jgi:hypothetical protein
MNSYRRQRQTDFILNSLAQLTAKTNKLAESHVRDAGRLARLEDSFVSVTAMLNRHEDRHDDAHRRMVELESCTLLLIQLLRKLRLSVQQPEQDNQEEGDTE